MLYILSWRMLELCCVLPQNLICTMRLRVYETVLQLKCGTQHKFDGFVFTGTTMLRIWCPRWLLIVPILNLIPGNAIRKTQLSYQFIRMFPRMSNVWHKRSSKIEFDAHRIPFSKAMYQMYWLNTDQRVSGESSSRTEFSVHKIPWKLIKFLDQNPIRISLSAKDSQWSIPDWCYPGTKYYSLICRNRIPFQWYRSLYPKLVEIYCTKFQTLDDDVGKAGAKLFNHKGVEPKT